jgi:predicted CoA-binding protein
MVDEETLARDVVRAAQTVAVVGMKGERTPEAPAHTVPAVMQRRGIRVIPVNPTIDSALGAPSLPSVAALREKVDVIQVFRRSSAVAALADEILAMPAELRPKVVWLQSGIVDENAAAKLRAAGMDVIMDRCFAVDMAKYRR